MKSIAIRKKAMEIRLWERSSRGTPDSTVVPLTRPPVCFPRSWDRPRMATAITIAIPSISRTG